MKGENFRRLKVKRIGVRRTRTCPGEKVPEPRLKVKCSTGQRLDDFVWLEHEVVADESGMVQRVRLWEAD